MLDEAVAAPEIADLDEAAISHAAAAPEIATLLASPPEWLSGPRDAATWAAPARPPIIVELEAIGRRNTTVRAAGSLRGRGEAGIVRNPVAVVVGAAEA